MEIYIRGLASGYEPEHVTRLFFQPALLAKRWPARGADAVAELRGKKRFVCGVRMNGLCAVPKPPQVTQGVNQATRANAHHASRHAQRAMGYFPHTGSRLPPPAAGADAG